MEWPGSTGKTQLTVRKKPTPPDHERRTGNLYPETHDRYMESRRRVEMEKFFSLVVFNYLFSNGDAHLKNFSLLESVRGDYLLSPGYDLINTRIHVSDTDFALDKGLFADGFESATYKKNNHPSKTDFEEFARRVGVTESRIDKLLAPFLERNPLVETLTNRSFLNESGKRGYIQMYNTKRNYLAGL